MPLTFPFHSAPMAHGSDHDLSFGSKVPGQDELFNLKSDIKPKTHCLPPPHPSPPYTAVFTEAAAKPQIHICTQPTSRAPAVHCKISAAQSENCYFLLEIL